MEGGHVVTDNHETTKLVPTESAIRYGSYEPRKEIPMKEYEIFLHYGAPSIDRREGERLPEGWRCKLVDGGFTGWTDGTGELTIIEIEPEPNGCVSAFIEEVAMSFFEERYDCGTRKREYRDHVRYNYGEIFAELVDQRIDSITGADYLNYRFMSRAQFTALCESVFDESYERLW